MTVDDSTTTQLLDRAAHNDGAAVSELMTRHRSRIRAMVAIRMEQALQSRFDPSDVVQDTLIEATRKLPQYLEHRRIGFYPWLRDIAVNRLIELHRRHVRAVKRSTMREHPQPYGLSDESCFSLAERLVDSGANPSHRLQRSEARQRVKQALLQLSDDERELLVLKYLEELTANEIAEVIEVTQRTFWRRHGRAIERLGLLLERD